MLAKRYNHPPTTRGAAGILAALAVFVACAAAPAAHADSIVYLKDKDVWIMNPDATVQYQVTLNGADSEYKSPSQADDGTIVALRGSKTLVRMRQNGAVINEFEPIGAFRDGINNVRVSPDGSTIAYETFFRGDSGCTVGSFGTTYCYGTYITSSAGGQAMGGEVFMGDPSWMSNSRLLVQNGGAFSTYDVGGTKTKWFSDPAVVVSQGDVSRQGDKIAAAALGGGKDHLRLYSSNGPPPAQPTARCQFIDPAGGQFHGPTWSPTGNALAWGEGDSSPTSPDEGIWISPVGDITTDSCTSLSSRLLLQGATHPHWGPADVNPGQRVTPILDPGAELAARSLKVRPNKVRPASRGASIAAKKKKTGATVSYTLSGLATTTFTIEQVLPGRVVGGKCVKETRKNRKAKRCTIYRQLKGSFVHQGKAGANSFKFTGRLNKKRLKIGRYRLTAVPTDPAGNVGQPARASFGVIK